MAPVNIDLVPNYKTVFSDLKEQPYNTFDGKPYGIPHGRGANLLMWNKRRRQAGAEILERHDGSEGRRQIQGQDQPVRRTESSPKRLCISNAISRTWKSKTPTS